LVQGVTYTTADAGRSLWAALQTSQLLQEMSTMGFTRHPLLAPYTVSHPYRRRVARKKLTALDTKIRKARTADFEDEFINLLEGLKTFRPGLFEPGIDVAEAYSSLFRSLRQGSNMEAVTNKVEPEIIDMNNRWRKFERARGRMPSLSMQQHYTQMQGVLMTLYEYSHSL
jgi:hypothetical protein